MNIKPRIPNTDELHVDIGRSSFRIRYSVSPLFNSEFFDEGPLQTAHINKIGAVRQLGCIF